MSIFTQLPILSPRGGDNAETTANVHGNTTKLAVSVRHSHSVNLQNSPTDNLYLYVDKSVLFLRYDSTVFSSYSESVEHFSVLREKFCCPDLSTLTVNFKVSHAIVLKIS